jgi:hypothetical protein
MILQELHNTIIGTISNSIKQIKLEQINIISSVDTQYSIKYRVNYNNKSIFILDISTEINTTIFINEYFDLLININHQNQILNDSYSNISMYGILIAKLIKIINYIIETNKKIKNKFITDSQLNNISNYDIIWLKLNKNEYYLIRITSKGYILNKFYKKNYNLNEIKKQKNTLSLTKIIGGILEQDTTFIDKNIILFDDLLNLSELQTLHKGIYNNIIYLFI